MYTVRELEGPHRTSLEKKREKRTTVRGGKMVPAKVTLRGRKKTERIGKEVGGKKKRKNSQSNHSSYDEARKNEEMRETKKNLSDRCRLR